MKDYEPKSSATLDMTKKEIIKILREKKYRITNQREMILDIILEGDCSCCKEIYYKAVKKDSGIGVATVYRMINTLEDIGAINRKNQYQIRSGCEEAENGVCRIILDDLTKVELTGEVWKEVLISGLKCCGMVNDQNLKSIEFIGEDEEKVHEKIS